MLFHLPDGYSGEIKILVGIDKNGNILGTRVIKHQETPGLGDFIDYNKSDWINIFTYSSLKNTPEIEWAVHAPYIHKINKLKKEKNAIILAQQPIFFSLRTWLAILIVSVSLRVWHSLSDILLTSLPGIKLLEFI